MSGDNKSANKDNFFELLGHEKKISELYQNNKQHQTEEPSVQVDAEIMAMAKQQLSDNTNLPAKDQTPKQQLVSNNKMLGKTQKAWQWPVSLVASVGILSVLFITQKDYFIHPKNNVTGDVGILNKLLRQGPEIGTAKTLSDEVTTEQFIEESKMRVSAQKNEGLIDKKFTAMATKSVSIGKSPKMFKEQMLKGSKNQNNSANTAFMSLPDMSKLAALLKLELAGQNLSEFEVNDSNVKIQQTLFENLAEYQKNHVEFKISKKYLSVLTQQQRQKLKLDVTEAVPEN
jgi:hypothetical protein